MDNMKRKIYKEFNMGDPAKVYEKGVQHSKRPILFISDTSFAPPTDVWETDEMICILMEISGMTLEGFNIQYLGGYLVVEGEREEPEILANSLITKYYKKEIDYGKFRVKVKMNTRISNDEIIARYQEGFLSITLPKNKEGKKSAKIHIPVKGK